MSAAQRKPKKRSFISQLLCCFSPDVENEPSRTAQHSPAKQEKVTAQRIQPQGQEQSPITRETGSNILAPTSAIATIEENEKHGSSDDSVVPARIAVDRDGPSTTKSEIGPVSTKEGNLPLPTSDMAPALGRAIDGAAAVVDKPEQTTIGTPEILSSPEPISEEKLALLEDEPLSPSSAVMTATEPLPESIKQEASPLVSDDEADSKWLLPRLAPSLKGRKCLVLDLDETLVHSSFKVIHQADFVVPVEIDGIYHNVYVIKRPGVDNFMLEMGKYFEIVVFTASLAKYADPVLDILDVHKVVHHRLFRESCHNHQGNYVKDLSQLGRELKDAIIIDNSPASYVFHPAHAVPISSWFNDVHDTELTDLIPFLKDLTTVEDISQILELSI